VGFGHSNGGSHGMVSQSKRSGVSGNNGSGMSSNNGSGGSMSISHGSGMDSNSGLVHADGVLVNDGGLHNMLDGVDSVGLGDSVGLFNLDGVGLGNMFVNNDFPFDGDGHGDGDLDGVFVHLKLGLNASDLGGDVGVGADGGGDSLDGDGIGRGGSLVGGCGRDSSVRCRCSGDGRGSDGDSGLGGLGLTSDIGVGSGLADRCVLSVSVSGLDSLGTHLDLTVSDNFVVGLSNGGSSMHMFLDTVAHNSGGGSIGGMGQRSSMCQRSSMHQRSCGVVAPGGGLAKSHQH